MVKNRIIRFGHARPLRLMLACVGLFFGASLANGQWLSEPTPGIPRLADGSPDLTAPVPLSAEGNPDLSGLWVATDVRGDLPNPSQALPWARELIDQRAANFYADQPRYNCLPSGPSYLTASATSNGLRRIVQGADVIAILHEDMAHRSVFMDGRELEPAPLPSWMGYSVGRWEGDELVVESNGYNDKTWLDRRGAPHTEALRMTERYRRIDFGHMLLEVTYDDPGAYESPLQVEIDLEYRADDELLEYVCNETAQLGSEWSGDISQSVASAVSVDPAVLAGYVGTYEGEWLGNLIRLEFRLEEGALKLRRNGVEVQLAPQSDRAFDSSIGFGFIFSVDAEGQATAVEELHVSGGWLFPRVR